MLSPDIFYAYVLIKHIFQTRFPILANPGVLAMENKLQLFGVGVPHFGGDLAAPVPAVAEMRGISVDAFAGTSSPSLQSFWTAPSLVAPSSSRVLLGVQTLIQGK